MQRLQSSLRHESTTDALLMGMVAYRISWSPEVCRTGQSILSPSRHESKSRRLSSPQDSMGKICCRISWSPEYPESKTRRAWAPC